MEPPIFGCFPDSSAESGEGFELHPGNKKADTKTSRAVIRIINFISFESDLCGRSWEAEGIDSKFIAFFVAFQSQMGNNTFAFSPLYKRPLSLVLKLFIRKIIQLALMLVVVSAVAFRLLDAAGGDSLAGLSDNPNISAETIRRLRDIYGLDRPVSQRYLEWAANAAKGDFGDSISLRLPVTSLVLSRAKETFKLAALTLVIALFVSSVLAFASVRYRHWLLDSFVEICVLVTASLPVIVSSLMILAITVYLINLPAAGGLFLPAISLTPPFIAMFLAQSKRGLQTALQQDYIVSARAKGLDETTIILRHALRNALNPIITLTGLSVGALIGGSVIAETVFGLQGIGSLTVTAVRNRDIPLVMGVVVFVSFAVWVANFSAELLQIVNDRRLVDAERS